MDKDLDLLNVVLFPEFFEPIEWPISFYPTYSTKQKTLIDKAIPNCNVSIYPGKDSEEIVINDIKIDIMKNKKYMKEKFIYACSIIISADNILFEKKNYKNVIRIIYEPINEFRLDTERDFNFYCKNLKEINITRHIQFIPHPQYSYLFQTKKKKVDKDEIDKFYYYLNLYKHAY
jgi:hypothetical protein